MNEMDREAALQSGNPVPSVSASYFRQDEFEVDGIVYLYDYVVNTYAQGILSIKNDYYIKDPWVYKSEMIFCEGCWLRFGLGGHFPEEPCVQE